MRIIHPNQTSLTNLYFPAGEPQQTYGFRTYPAMQ